jgi:hypothetical protein
MHKKHFLSVRYAATEHLISSFEGSRATLDELGHRDRQNIRDQYGIFKKLLLRADEVID